MAATAVNEGLRTSIANAYRQDSMYILTLAPLLFAFGFAVETISHLGRGTPMVVWVHALMSAASVALFALLKLRDGMLRFPELGLCFLWATVVVSVITHVVSFGYDGVDASTLVLSLIVVGTGALILPTVAGTLTLGLSSCILFLIFYLDSMPDPLAKISVPLVVTIAGVLVFLARRWNIRQSVHRRHMDEKLHEQSAKLQSANAVAEMSARLSASFAHHFNNQLQTVLLGADGVMMMLPDSHPSRALLTEIHNSALRGAQMTSSLLQYAGDKPISKERISARALVEEFSFAQVNSGSVQLRVDVADGDIYADKDLLASVIYELLGNADNAVADRGGQVDLKIESSDNGAVLWIVDDGDGIPEGLQGAATDPFVTSEPASRFGLGLALASSIVEKHNGTLEIESSRQSGTRIRIWLPPA